MAENDDVITTWRERVGSLRKRGRISAAALTVVPGGVLRPFPIWAAPVERRNRFA